MRPRHLNCHECDLPCQKAGRSSQIFPLRGGRRSFSGTIGSSSPAHSCLPWLTKLGSAKEFFQPPEESSFSPSMQKLPWTNIAPRHPKEELLWADNTPLLEHVHGKLDGPHRRLDHHRCIASNSRRQHPEVQNHIVDPGSGGPATLKRNSSSN